MIRVGVVGCGYWGPKLVRNFDEVHGFDMAAVSDLNGERLKSIKKKYPHLVTTISYKDVLKDPEIDAVAVATPISTHYKVAKETLERGKHVLVEKPLALESVQASELIEITEKNKKVLMVDSTFLYTEEVRRIKEIIDSGELGDLYYIDSIRVNLGRLDKVGRATGFYPDANVLYDLAPHDLSIMNFLVHSDPVKISCIGKCYVPYNESKHETIAHGSIEFSNGTIGHFHVSWLAPEQVKRTTIVGSKKMVVYDDLAKEPIRVYDKGVKVNWSPQKSGSIVDYYEGKSFVPQIDKKEALAVELEHFLDCIQNDKEPLTNGKDELQVVRLLEGAQKSLRNEGKVIKL